MKRINFSGRKILWMLFFPLTTIFMTDNAFAADPPQAEYEAALAEITDGSYYLVTEVNGTKFYITQNGYLTDDKETAYLFDISKVNASAAKDRLFDVAFNIDPGNGAHFSNTTLVNGKAFLYYGAYRQDRGNNRDDWERQIFYLNAEGKYAIRSCNTIYGENSWNDAGRAFWTWEIENPDAYYPVPCYSYDPAYIWSLELPADSKEEIYVVLEQILTTYEQQLYDNVDEPTSVKMYSGGGPGYGTLADWETWRNFKAELYRLDTLWLKFLDDDYNPLSDPDCPNLDGVTAWKAKLDSMWLQILDSEIPYKIPKDGYYRIMTRMRYYTDTDIKDVETGEVVDIERSYANKALLASYDKNYPNVALWGTLKKQSANFIWKLTQVGDSILMQNVGMENYVSMASSDRLMLTTDNAQISHVVFDYAANALVDLDNEVVDYRDIFYIRLTNQPRHSGRYVHQLDHNRGKDSHMDLELCFWNETYGYGEPYTTDGGTSEWYLEPVSEDEVAELAEKFVPIREHAVLVQKNQKLRDEVHQTIFTKILTAATLGSPHSDSLEGNLNNLIDGDKSTFWHSDWHGEKPEGMYIGLTSEEIGYHYLLLSGVENMVGECELYLCQRNSKNDHPKTIYLFGSNDASAPDSAWIQMAVIEVPNVGPGEENTIPFTIKTAYPYVRFVVTDCLGASYPFRVIWHAAEIQITAKNNIFNFLGEISTNLERIYNENCAVADEDITILLYEELEAAFNHYLNKIKETETNISFVDANVKALCISNWDINGDGELSYGECAAVKSLGDVFKGNTAIKSFDELQYFTNLTSIGDYAFFQCTLTNVTIPSSVTSIGNDAFNGCRHLTNVVIPESVTTIGWTAFYNCIRLTNFIIPSSVTSIGTSAFGCCSSLTSIEIPNGVTYISNWAFEDCRSLATVIIPNSVTSIRDGAFKGCTSLKSITLPESLREIRWRAFYECSNLERFDIPQNVKRFDEGVLSGDCNQLKEITVADGNTSFKVENGLLMNIAGTIVYAYAFGCENECMVIPESVKQIASFLFEGNKRLKTIQIPSGVTSIGRYTFSDCISLEEVTLPDGIQAIEYYAFGGCKSLQTVTIPADLTKFNDNIFSGCNAIRSVMVRQENPLAINQSFFSNEVYTNATLYIPKGLRVYFVNAAGWKEFQKIEEVEMDGIETSDIYISQHIEYTDSLISNDPLFALRPDIKLHYYSDDVNVRGHLTVDEGTTLSLGKFVQTANWGSKNDGSKYTQTGVDYYHPTTLLTKGVMRADSVIVKQSLYRDRWHFISLPFNVNVSDIETPNDTYWALRRYNGGARAAGHTDETWQNLRNGDMMKAGQGFIIQLTKEGEDKSSSLTFKAINDAKKNNIFTTDNVDIPMEEYPSEFAHNRGWNLLGNPYPAFYDSRYIDHEGTIIIWNGNGYSAYSLSDDNYILMPFEAFFIQKPLNADALTFSKNGRQHSYEVLPRAANARQAKNLRDRRILNFTISDGSNIERSRVVINEQASLEYESDKDAPKFMEAKPQTAQLFSVHSGVQYAINERPMGDGQIVFSIFAPIDGEYRFSVDGDTSDMVVLDTETGAVWNLIDGDYVFTVTEGQHNARLIVSLTGDATAISQVNAYDDGEIKVSGGQLSFSFMSNKHIKVFSLDGRVLFNDVTSRADVKVSHGVYLVDIDGKTTKIMVK